MLPWATYVLAVRKKEEAHRTDSASVEEEVLAQPFGRTFWTIPITLVLTEKIPGRQWRAMVASGPQDVGGVDSYSDTYIDSSEQREL